MMKAIETEKRTLSWQPGDVAPLVRTSMLERKTKERELDPVAMVFRSQEKEAEHAALRMQRTHAAPLQRLETIKQTQFNIVSHEGGPPRRIAAVRQELDDKRADAPDRGWHLFSHLPPKKHTQCPTLYDESYMAENVRHRGQDSAATGTSAGGAAFHVPKANPREFNIISNHFSTNHDERLREEYNAMKQITTKKFWDTHSGLDLIRQEYVDDRAELVAREREHQASLVHGLAQAASMPQSFKFSEGRSYDIINQEVKDPELIKVALRKGSQQHNRLNKYRDLPKQQLRRGEEEYAAWEQRRLQRVSFKRWEEQLDRGYDFVHTKFLNPAHQPLPVRAPPLWARISTAAGAGAGSGAGAGAGLGAGVGDSTLGSSDGSWGTASVSAGVGAGAGLGESARRGLGPASSRLAPPPSSARARPHSDAPPASGPGSARAPASAPASAAARAVPGLDMRSVRTGGLSEYA